jgi:hypothetical protein
MNKRQLTVHTAPYCAALPSESRFDKQPVYVLRCCCRVQSGDSCVTELVIVRAGVGNGEWTDERQRKCRASTGMRLAFGVAVEM